MEVSHNVEGSHMAQITPLQRLFIIFWLVLAMLTFVPNLRYSFIHFRNIEGVPKFEIRVMSCDSACYCWLVLTKVNLLPDLKCLAAPVPKI